MKKSFPIVVAFAITILFFIQLAGTLVESIYILDLMNLQLDEKALGVLFFFVPILLFPLFKRFARLLVWVTSILLLVVRGLLPYINTSQRMLAAGLGTVAATTLFFLLLSACPGGVTAPRLGLWGAAGLGVAVLLSGFLRTVGYGLDISLIPAGAWLGWILGLVLVAIIATLSWEDSKTEQKSGQGITGAIIGVLLLLDLIWFSFSAPAVIVRWTEGNYTLIVALVSLLAAATTWICITRPQWLDRISASMLLVWNILFTLSLTGTLLAQHVPFATTPHSAPVVVSSPSLPGQIALVLTLLLFPVLILDLRLFITRIAQTSPTARDLVPGFLIGMLITIVLIFINIFSNVWGYVPPVSMYFRGTFWLTFFLLAGSITLLAWLVPRPVPATKSISENSIHWGWGIVLGVLFLGTVIRSLPTERGTANSADRNSLIVMTYNIQEANDNSGEKSFDRQLALMRQVSPDIISLQESDSTRISLNNNDYVRYFAEQLGYHSYYGPRTVTGTYGTAILSKYPLEDTRTVFSYSDTDEIGIAQAEIEVDDRRITIYDVHPDGSETAKLVFARTLLDQSRDKPYVIALGDYNLRDEEEPYQLIGSVFTNAWTSVYPSEIGLDGLDMSGENRIDHIFVSPALGVRNPIYIIASQLSNRSPRTLG